MEIRSGFSTCAAGMVANQTNAVREYTSFFADVLVRGDPFVSPNIVPHSIAATGTNADQMAKHNGKMPGIPSNPRMEVRLGGA